MKKTILILLTGIFASVCIESPGQKKGKSQPSSPQVEENAIKTLIENESKAFFFDINQEAWADCWAQVPYSFWSFADTTDVNSFSGWDNIRKGFESYFKTAKPSTAKIERKWLHIKVYGNTAYVRFTQQVLDETERPPQAEVRVLEKIDGKWKIVCVTVIAQQKDNEPIR
jgi:hypothetical protein